MALVARSKSIDRSDNLWKSFYVLKVNNKNFVLEDYTKYPTDIAYNILNVNKLCKLMIKRNLINDLKNNYQQFDFDTQSNMVDLASRYGNVDVLDYLFKNKKTIFKYTDESLYEATFRKHINVLNWWRDHEGATRWSDRDVKKYNLKLKFDLDEILFDCEYFNNTKGYDWWISYFADVWD